MLWVKINNFVKKNEVFVYTLLFLIFFLITRLPRLNNDIINPDGVNWHYRSQQFVNGLKYFQFEKTYQHYHPGVTLMWITGIPIELAKFITGYEVYNHLNFILFDSVAKYSLVFVQLLLTFISIFLLAKITDIKKSFIIVSLFTLEPFFLGNSRLYHLDVLLTLFVFISLLLTYIYVNDISICKNIKNKKREYFLIGALLGLSLALSFLTKSIGIGTLVYVISYMLVRYFQNRKKVKVSSILLVFFNFLFFTILLFPALWIHPIGYLVEIFSEGERVGVRKGHEQIILGETTQDAGLLFYPIVLSLKLTPFIILGFITYFVVYFKGIKTIFSQFVEKAKSLNWFLGVFYFGYFLVMSFPSKKIDRYMVMMYPIFAYFAYLGFEWLVNKYGKRALLLIKISFLGFVIYPLFSFYPYYFTYFSPIFVNAQNAHNVIAQKPFGVGMYNLKEHIISKYGEVNLGFIDTKPMESIYPASKVFDARVSGTSSYDVLILGPNEEIPEEALNSDVLFVKDLSVYINDLEYWRVYVKAQ